jgi:hypothetical protein
LVKSIISYLSLYCQKKQFLRFRLFLNNWNHVNLFQKYPSQTDFVHKLHKQCYCYTNAWFWSNKKKYKFPCSSVPRLTKRQFDWRKKNYLICLLSKSSCKAFQKKIINFPVFWLCSFAKVDIISNIKNKLYNDLNFFYLFPAAIFKI